MKQSDNTGNNEDSSSTVRLDKWLWAARFFKTRSLCAEAINGGKVSLNGNRAQPGKKVRTGDILRISRGQDRMIVVVQAISDRRRGAPEAVLLYTETEESLRQRKLVKQQRLASQPASAHRPDKHARRQLTRIKRQD